MSMQAFTRLFLELDSTTGALAKEQALRRYLDRAEARDAAWAVYFLAGGNPRRLVKTAILKTLPGLVRDLPDWLFSECYDTVGDLAETIALLLPAGTAAPPASLSEWIERRLLPLRAIPAERQAACLLPLLAPLDAAGKLICLKLITGGFRVGVSRPTVIKALAAFAGADAKLIAQRLVGFLAADRRPTPEDFARLIQSGDAAPAADNLGLPYPFFLAHPLMLGNDQTPADLGAPEHWLAEWKWDGIRAQLVKRQNRIWLWSRGEELITERFPEIAEAAARSLPDGTVMDGEIVVWQDGGPQSFAALQKRIGRLKVTPKLLREAPARFIAYDLLEWRGHDLRGRPLTERRELLETECPDSAGDRLPGDRLPGDRLPGDRLPGDRLPESHLQLSPLLPFRDWQSLVRLRQESRSRNVEGLMLKRGDSRYGIGRTKGLGVWWKWKIEPFTIDAVLINAQRGHGRRASLYTDYTFAVWSEAENPAERTLLPFAKAYSGLTDTELKEADSLIRKTTLERFGPVCVVEPTQVFEIGFEGLALSNRHKSGISVRFPRILRWRRDKPIHEANSVEDLRRLL